MSPPSSGASFSIESVDVVFDAKTVLDSVSVAIDPGEIIAFVGPSGAGKTSLLRLLNASLRPTSGSVNVDGKKLSELSGKELRALRADLGFVHQDLALVPNLRVSQNVVSGRLGRMKFWRSLRTMIWPDRSVLLRVHEILERVGIADKIFQRTDRLSGGQRQRVAIARALFQEARALLVDEPVSSLDPARARDTVKLLTTIAREAEITLIASMHDLALAQEFFSRLVGIRGGRVVFDQPAGEISDKILEQLYRLDAEEIAADGC